MILSQVFPTFTLALEWVKNNYTNTDPKMISYNIMDGVGTRVIIKELNEIEE
jgi:hypothetical protein